MFPTQATISVLAERIERAFLLRHPLWVSVGVSPRVWELAASGLCLLNRRDASVPIDPELFVATQPVSGVWPDPWTDLIPPCSLDRYQRTIRRIVRQLRSELRAELKKAERRIIKGMSVDELLENPATTLSPLGSYVLAHQTGRDDLLLRYRAEAEQQHLACPLYRQACLTLLPDGLYPEPVNEDDAFDPAELGDESHDDSKSSASYRPNYSTRSFSLN